MRLAVIGTDAGYSYWNGHEWVHVEGWAVERLAELRSALAIMRESSQLKTPGLAQAAAKSVSEFVTKEMGQHIKEGGVVILG
jgi:hypothetical protein